MHYVATGLLCKHVTTSLLGGAAAAATAAASSGNFSQRQQLTLRQCHSAVLLLVFVLLSLVLHWLPVQHEYNCRVAKGDVLTGVCCCCPCG